MRGLLVVRASHPGPISARDFQRGLGYETEDSAALLRHDLTASGLLSADERRVPIPIRLTPHGRAVADLAAQLDALAPGVVDRPRALLALLTVLENEPEPTTAAQLREAVGYGVVAGARLRDDLRTLRLFDVEEGLENRVRFVRIHLTPLGRKAANLAQRIQETAQKARDADRRGRA